MNPFEIDQLDKAIKLLVQRTAAYGPGTVPGAVQELQTQMGVSKMRAVDLVHAAIREIPDLLSREGVMMDVKQMIDEVVTGQSPEAVLEGALGGEPEESVMEMWGYEVGDRVQVTNQAEPRVGAFGEVVGISQNGAISVSFPDTDWGDEMYRPSDLIHSGDAKGNRLTSTYVPFQTDSGRPF